MNSYLHRIALAALLVVSITASSHADEAQDIIDRYIKATGGENAHRSVKTRVTEGSMVMGPMNATLQIYQKEPNLFRMNIKLGQFGEQQMGYDGSRGWQKVPGMGVSDLPPGQLAQQLRDMSMLRELELDKHFSTKKAISGKTINGKPVDAIELTQKDGDKQTWYFDKDSHFLIRVEAIADTGPQGKLNTSTDMTNYKEFDGIKLPTKSKTTMPIGTMEMNFTSVKHNTDLPIKTFQP